MKLKCSCGNVIVDQSDHLSYKAHFVSDTTYEQMWREIDALVERLVSVVSTGQGLSDWKESLFGDRVVSSTDSPGRTFRLGLMSIANSYSRELYECEACGMLWAPTADRWHPYSSDGGYKSILNWSPRACPPGHSGE